MKSHRAWVSCFLITFTVAVLLTLSQAVQAQLFPLNNVIQACLTRYGSQSTPIINNWYSVLGVFQSGSETNKLRDINDFFNRKLRWDTDQTIWGINDYWATPIESLLRNAGDCEDFAIAKYFSLKYLGVPVSKLRITYVKAQIGGQGSSVSQAHMVLTYYPEPDAEPLVLDNLVGEIRPASRRPDLIPVFSFNAEGVWQAGANQRSQGGGISLWNDLLNKMAAEGFAP